MPDRLSALDASFLYLEDRTTPMHVGGVALFRAPRAGFDYDRLVRLIENRLFLVPRYRQRVRGVLGRLSRPVWVDDTEFDITYHVRRSALPKPGSEEQLTDLVARLLSRAMDPQRPLWEVYLVEGLARGRFAVVTKTHQAMIDGIGAIDIGQVMLDTTSTPREVEEPLWMPEPHPSTGRLVLDAAAEAVRRPGVVVENSRLAVRDAAATAAKVVETVGGLASVLWTAASRAPGSPLNVRISSQRRFAMARTRLKDYRVVRAHHDCSVNDVVLAVVAGALRSWLLSRGEAVSASTVIRALSPLSTREGLPDTGVEEGAGQVSGYLVDLPVGEPNPAVRLAHISHAMRAHKESGRSVGADTLVRLSGFAPPTLHAMGVRAANSFAKRIFNLLVTNVPGPQLPLYAAGARMEEMFPIVPLARNQALSIGVTSYHGGVFYGLNADREAMPDVDVIGSMVVESLEELMGTVPA